MEIIKEIWAAINKFLKETLREILTKKFIDNLLIYTIYFLTIFVILYVSIHLFGDLIANFTAKEKKNEFPFILEFSEKIFLYFLPIFILFGLINFYDLEWRRQLNKSDKLNPLAQKYLTLSKKLFFSSVLSYITLKIVDMLFFNFNNFKNNVQIIGIGIFFIILSALVIFQNQTSNKNNNE